MCSAMFFVFVCFFKAGLDLLKEIDTYDKSNDLVAFKSL